MKRRNFTYLGIVVLFLLGALMPALLKQYHLHMLTEIIIFALYAVSYNLLLGYAGLLSFGHAMFFGLGAFMTAVAIIHLKGLSLLNAVLIGFAAAVFEALIAESLVSEIRPALRVTA